MVRWPVGSRSFAVQFPAQPEGGARAGNRDACTQIGEEPKIVVSDGRLLVDGRRGRGAGTLLRNSAGDLVLNIDMTLDDNSTLTTKLWPSR